MRVFDTPRRRESLAILSNVREMAITDPRCMRLAWPPEEAEAGGDATEDVQPRLAPPRPVPDALSQEATQQVADDRDEEEEEAFARVEERSDDDDDEEEEDDVRRRRPSRVSRNAAMMTT